MFGGCCSDFYQGDYEYSMIQSVPFCIASHLEELKLDSFGCMKSQYHVARFFMRNGAMLKGIYVCVNDDADTEIAPIIEKLSRFPKASACLKIGLSSLSLWHRYTKKKNT